MTTETKLRAGITMSLLGLIMVTFAYLEKDRVNIEITKELILTRDSLSKQKMLSDSFENELNVQNMINSELSNNWEILREINPILADSIDNQTE